MQTARPVTKPAAAARPLPPPPLRPNRRALDGGDIILDPCYRYHCSLTEGRRTRQGKHLCGRRRAERCELPKKCEMRVEI